MRTFGHVVILPEFIGKKNNIVLLYLTGLRDIFLTQSSEKRCACADRQGL
jgi:hypothetical protein